MPTMLVVDDEYLVRLRIKETIDWKEHDVEIIGEACDGEEGLKLALQRLPDIIITDIRMPFLDGLEFMEKLRQNNIQSSIIVLSGYDEFDYARSAINNGADAYLLKPIDNKLLIETVNKAIGKIKNERSTKQYYDKLKKELSSIKKQFLRDLIKGNICEREEIHDKIQFFDIPLELEENFVLDIQIDNYDLAVQQLKQEELQRLRNSVADRIAGELLLGSKFIGLMVDMEPNEWVVLLHPYNYGTQEEVIGIIRECCKLVINEMKAEFQQTLSFGISNICRQLYDISAAYGEAKEAAGNKLLSGTSSIVFAGDTEITEYRPEVREAIKFIKKNYHKDISADQVAKELHISPFYLMHLLKNELGKTFNECLTECRIEAAKELLMNPDLKIYEVCEKVGYMDVKYFGRVFKRLIGLNPSDYVRLKLEI